MAVLAGGAAWRESVAIDEVVHIGAGVSYLQRFDLRLNPEHPPLAKMLAALPLAMRYVRGDYSATVRPAAECRTVAAREDACGSSARCSPGPRRLFGLRTAPFALTDPSTYVPESQFGNCQRPATSDAGLWAAVFSTMILDVHSCAWLLEYPHVTVRGGSMYILDLPEKMPAAGVPEDHRSLQIRESSVVSWRWAIDVP
jgi:hypothetical protein